MLDLNSAIYKIGIPLVSGILFTYTFIAKGNQLKYPFVWWIIGFVGVAVISSFLNQIDTFSLLYFLIYTVLSYSYFIVLVNETSPLLISRIVSFIKILILIQIPAIFIKFLLIGQTEHGGIGTLSINAGSVSTIFPLFLITILFCLYLFENKSKYLFYILCFSLFGIVGNKRAILIFIPIVLFICGLLFVKLERRRYFQGLINKIALVCVMGVGVFYLTARTNKTLNPEHRIWGSFDLNYIVSYVDNYTNSGSNDKYQMRRKDGLIYFINYTLKENKEEMLFGDGAGKLIESKYNAREGTMKNEYGVRYGGRMALIWLLLQVGVLGTLIYMFFYIRLFSLVLKKYKSNPVYLSFLVLTIVFFIDTIIYSNVFLRYEYLKGLYFVLLGLILLDQKYNTNYFSKLVHF
ncbi:hypothetical protein [Ancylomarina longa]|uniref:hypothetical protein n=1 Tax=Ancylomarina longa TaxID=2487017 RepID=UPI000FC9A3EF|nr:hypothetical protein [Ancylomarina longa]